MSDATADSRLADVTLDRMIAETSKLVAESTRMVAEAAKLAAEERKLKRDALVAPWQLTLAGIGGVAGLLAAIVTAAKALGIHAVGLH